MAFLISSVTSCYRAKHAIAHDDCVAAVDVSSIASRLSHEAKTNLSLCFQPLPSTPLKVSETHNSPSSTQSSPTSPVTSDVDCVTSPPHDDRARSSREMNVCL